MHFSTSYLLVVIFNLEITVVQQEIIIFWNASLFFFHIYIKTFMGITFKVVQKYKYLFKPRLTVKNSVFHIK